MKIGVSLPFDYLCRGGEPYGERERFCQKLRSYGVGWVELRTVSPKTDPKEVLRAAQMLWNAGLRITVHGGIGSPESAVEDLFAPLKLLFSDLKQEKVNITFHPVVGDNMAILKRLSTYIRENRIPATLTMENNRRLPDRSLGDSTGLVERAVENCDPEIVGTTFDMGHFYYQCGFDRQALPRTGFMKRVRHTHIHATRDGNTHFPLQYDLPLEAYIAGLGEDYDGIYNLELEPSRWPELNPGEELFESIERLKKAVPYSYKAKQGLRESFLNDLRDAARVYENRSEENLVAVTQSSSYLFRTEGVNWSMDVVLREAVKIPGAGEALREALRSSEFTVITHGHADHFEEETMPYLTDLPMKWILPYFMEEDALAWGLKKEQLILARPGEEISVGKMTFLPFEGRHYRPGTRTGAEELGYLVSVGKKNYLFPGDVRDYDPAGFPNFNGVDVLFYHLWFGDNSLSDNTEVYEEQVQRFLSAFKPKRVLVGHLYEAGRTEDTMWRYTHAGRLANRCKLETSEMRMIQTVPGELYRI